MQIERKKLSELTPAPYNPRKISKNELEKLKRSIEELGYVEPIIWNKATGYVVGGHQRLKALQMLGVQEAECVIVDLSEAKEKALNIALNKISGKWDMDKLEDIFADLKLEADFDITLTGFELEHIEGIQEDIGYYGDEREKTYDLYLLNEYDAARVAGYYQFPILKACHVVPDDLIGFNYVKSWKGNSYSLGVHFFLDDYQFERMWNRLSENVKRLKKFSCVLTPDFSLYLDMPMAMKIWNVYRSRLIGQIMQDAGLNVIPTLQWAEVETLNFCFDGIEQGGVVAVSTVGVMKNLESQDTWRAGMDTAMEKIRPECVLCYGSRINYDFRDVKVKYVEARKFV